MSRTKNFSTPAAKRHGSAQGLLSAHALSLGFAAVLFALAAMAAIGFDLLSGARAYVGAESLWTKAQKAAVRSLHDYARRGADADWQRYRDSVGITLAYRASRETLARPHHDDAEAGRHLAAGGSDMADVGSMVRLHRWTSELAIMSQALRIWAEGDRLIDEINRLALQLHERVQRGERDDSLNGQLDSIDAIDTRLTKLEVRFSATLGEGARLIKTVFVSALAAAAVLLSLGSASLVYRNGRRTRRQAEALRASEERFRNAVTGGGDGFWDWDQSGRAVYVSERMESMLGHASGAMPRDIAALQALIHPHDRDRTLAIFKDHRDTGAACDLTLRVRMADGGWRWVRSRAQLRRDSETGHMHLAGFITDVHEQQLATLALRTSEARLRGIWETSRDAILIIDSDSIIRHCNPAVQAVLGYQPDELLNQPLERLQPPDLRQAHRLGVERFLATRQRHVPWQAVEVRALHKDGHELPVQLAFALMPEGDELHFISFMRPLAAPAARSADT
ncbi:PAS domain S-box protein [Paucibacter sediminis]|uniref:PAS domain S-box protein n=1 Tax=Paucibacter sediminis TaxID=3019553 RepID=A0AA95NIL1_9BURK|nr:PAS domain S-box protein [Paucibacter sp. S2-9]WIT13937.1 PAS domain S-box protein [Paucibacter sp. S2-9]